jgi:predicted transcriptional regulator with HTH domain
MKHETELNYVKNKIKKLEDDFAGFASLLIESGVVEVEEQNGVLHYKVNKVKLKEESNGKEKE